MGTLNPARFYAAKGIKIIKGATAAGFTAGADGRVSCWQLAAQAPAVHKQHAYANAALDTWYVLTRFTEPQLVGQPVSVRPLVHHWPTGRMHLHKHLPGCGSAAQGRLLAAGGAGGGGRRRAAQRRAV